jgi:hypothetical protein
MMMGMHPYFGFFAIIPTALLLTISFFVMVVLRKIEDKALKVFGWVIVILLWLSAGLIVSATIYKATSGSCPSMMMKNKMMGSGTMPGMPEGMPKPAKP